MEDSEADRTALRNKNSIAYNLKYGCRYVGPDGILVKFKNFNPRHDPKINASQYEDSFPDVGKDEMEQRFSQRRSLFLRLYDIGHPRKSLTQYMTAAQKAEGYQYTVEENTGPASLFLGGTVSRKLRVKGKMPECHLLGFIDEKHRVGCLAHPLAESSQGYDGRDQVGFFHHTCCCESVGCEARKEFRFLSSSALKVFDRAVTEMSWYEYSRHATSVLVYYLRSYDYILQRLDEKNLLDSLTLDQLAAFTNSIFDEWPLRAPDWSDRHPLQSIHIPEYPVTGRVLASSFFEWYTGPKHSSGTSSFAGLYDTKRLGPAGDWIRRIPFKLQSSDTGYRFVLMFPNGMQSLDVDLYKGNTPVFKGALVPELWRLGCIGDTSSSDQRRTNGESVILRFLYQYLSQEESPMTSLEILSTSISLSERILYLALDTWILPDRLDTQLRRVREYIENRLDYIGRGLALK